MNWAASVSDDLAPRWNAALELSGADRRGVADTRQLLAALAFAARPSLVLDFGFARGLTRASTAWSGFFGFTAVVGKIP